MPTVKPETRLARQLCLVWDEILHRETLSVEVEYRVRKLLDRVEPIQGKPFLQTAKGQDMLRQCLEMTGAVREALQRGGAPPWLALTDLEVLFDELLKTTYAFRVRTG
jgi:hypothetical protein